MAAQKVSKELSPGIILHRQSQGSAAFLLEIQNNKTDILEFTIDLAGSRNCSIRETGGSLERTVTIQPNSTVTLATIETKGDWKLNQKFKFVCKPPPREQVQGQIEASYAEIPAKAKQSWELISSKAVNSLTPKDIRRTIGHFVDPHFIPGDNSIFLGSEQTRLDTAIHWRRPSEFMTGTYSLFHGEIEPNDIKQGKLGDCWLMCALSSLAERPELVRRLFLIEEANAEGIYRVRLCKDGEWVTVTVDDYFPCFPFGGPIFSRSQGNELWVLLLEKAYAKIHGSYMLLRGGWAAEGMSDLTGCPTENLDFSHDDVKRRIANNELWPYLKTCDENGALMSASTPGEDRWTETGGPDKQGGLVPGHAYTLIAVKEAHGHRLLNIRNPWGTFEWAGNWSDNSPLWTPKMREAIKPTLTANDGTFWMSFDDFIRSFSGVNICHVGNYDEARMKGLFKKEVLDSQIRVTAQWYYTVTTASPAKVYLSLHQNDERMLGVIKTRSYLDLSIAVVERSPDGRLNLVRYEPASNTRQNDIQMTLQPGHTYMIVPRTTGCAMQRAVGVPINPVTLLHGDQMNPLFVSTVIDIFRKANVVLGDDLSAQEFSSLFAEVGVVMSSEEVTEKFRKYVSSPNGITIDGFVHYMHDMLKLHGEDTIFRWLQAWGYDRDLFSVGSRHFILTIHSEDRLQIRMHKANGTALSQRVDELILQQNGVKKLRVGTLDLYCLYESSANAFTYGVYNTGGLPVNCEFDCSQSSGVVYGTGSARTRHTIDPNSWEILNYMQIAKDSANCRIRPQLRITS
mmetsp:Transcript_6709/g.11909  ORF Transcript_6709/g.11909 Transcript_6709/m.11909 type:complete len:795 (-) Transcript_6709:1604-3988(-)